MTDEGSKVEKIPFKMFNVRALVDPFNDNNYYIFGSLRNNACFYFNEMQQKWADIIPKHISQNEVWGHSCAMFETENKNKYILIYGGDCHSGSSTHNIYDLQTQKWNANAIKLNNQWFNNKDIMYDGASKYGFGEGLSMITDLFVKNKIHIIGGLLSEQKYGYFEFNQQIIDNPKLSCVIQALFLRFFLACFSIVRICAVCSKQQHKHKFTKKNEQIQRKS